MIKRAKFAKPIDDVIDGLCNQIDIWVTSANKDGCVIGVSGGIDSAVVASLCTKASPKTTHGLFIDAESSEISYRYYTDLVKELGINHEYIEINEIVDLVDSELYLNEYDTGNLKSELRAVVLSRYAAKHNLLVMGTGNHDEDAVLGYFTKRGDGAVDNNILGNIPKRLVYELAEALNVPQEIIDREPTAELWKHQTDEEELGFTYEQAELVWSTHTYYSETVRNTELTRIEMSKVSKVPLETFNKILDMHNRNKHKTQLPPKGNVELIYE